jgi:hypothetical protein
LATILNMNAASTNASDDRVVAELLRELGPRLTPPQEMIASVRATVMGEWQELTARRRRQRRLRMGALAAGVLMTVTVAMSGLRTTRGPAVPLATILRIEGALRILDGHSEHTARTGEVLLTGQALVTDDDSTVALDMNGGLGVRIGTNSRLELTTPARITLEAGTLYVDSGHDAGGPEDVGSDPVEPQSVEPAAGTASPTQLSSLSVHTSAGTVRHIGTRYQVRMLPQSRGMEVSIREGQVQIESGGTTSTGSAGERLAVPHRGHIVRSTLAPFDPSWQWASRAAPQFDIAGRALHEFLRWAARETGRKLEYATPAARTSADQLKLGGSISGLDPDTALKAVLLTTRLRCTNPTPDRLRIELSGD